MDRQTLRAIVVEYRNKGWKFSQISEMLKKEYGIVRDRQSLHGIYTRAMNSMQEEKSKYDVGKVADVINIYALGYNMAETHSYVSELGHSLTYYAVRDIIANQENYINTVKNNLACKAVSLILEGKSIEDIKKALAYKDIEPDEKGLTAILTDAYTMIVLNVTTTELVKVYRDVGDINIIRSIIDRLGINIDISDIKNRA